MQKPSILLFDEATSSLDTHTEREVLSAVTALAAGRTALLVAHRLSTAAQCDQIVVLEQGSVVESGSHADLLSRNGQYAHLWAQHATVDDLDTLASAA
jgi:ABC-type transport system involved in Fe-S cluster assembly fused permease/ATPase subunit